MVNRMNPNEQSPSVINNSRRSNSYQNAFEKSINKSHALSRNTMSVTSFIHDSEVDELYVNGKQLLNEFQQSKSISVNKLSDLKHQFKQLYKAYRKSKDEKVSAYKTHSNSKDLKSFSQLVNNENTKLLRSNNKNISIESFIKRNITQSRKQSMIQRQ